MGVCIHHRRRRLLGTTVGSSIFLKVETEPQPISPMNTVVSSATFTMKYVV